MSPWGEVIVVLLFAVSFLGFINSLGELGVNINTHRSISMDTEEWLSPEDFVVRRNLFHQILIPALVVFVASVGASIGTGLLVAEQPVGAAVLKSTGAAWVLASLYTLAFALLVVTVTPARRPWHYTRSYETLYLHAMALGSSPSEREKEKVRARLSEIDESTDTGLSRCRQAALLLPALGVHEALHARPGRWVGLPQTAGGHKVSVRWSVVLQWATVKRRPFLAMLLALTVATVAALAVVGMTWSDGTRPSWGLALTVALSSSGVVLGALALRLDLVLYARLWARGQLARDEVLRLTCAAGQEQTSEVLIQLGPFALIRRQAVEARWVLIEAMRRM